MYDRLTRQRALTLMATGLTISEVRRRTGVSRAALREWRRRPTISRMADRCFRCSAEPSLPEKPQAYAYLLGLYLGDGCISRTARPGVYILRVFCADAWPGLRQECAQVMQAIRPDNRIGRIQLVGCSQINAFSKHWVCLFPQHGPGKKHLRRIVLQEWQQRVVEEHAADFVRGLFHSDGCRIANRVRRPLKDGDRWYEYPRYLFVNQSRDILRLCGEALDRLGIAWRYSKPNTVSVARREAVATLDHFVGAKY